MYFIYIRNCCSTTCICIWLEFCAMHFWVRLARKLVSQNSQKNSLVLVFICCLHTFYNRNECFLSEKKVIYKEHNTMCELLAKFFNLIFVLVYFSHAHSFWLVSSFIHTLHLKLGFPNKMIKAKQVVYSLGTKNEKRPKMNLKRSKLAFAI